MTVPGGTAKRGLLADLPDTQTRGFQRRLSRGWV